MNNSQVSYQGVVDDNVRSQLQDFLTSVAASNIDAPHGIKRLLCYALELMDNAQRYAIGKVSFEWTTDGNQLSLVLKNEATTEDSARLQQIVEQIRTMTAMEIDEAYKKQLTNSSFGAKGGAGLGYLLMARKGVRNMNIEVSPINTKHNLCISTIATNI